jgi:HEAT repeat protein
MLRALADAPGHALRRLAAAAPAVALAAGVTLGVARSASAQTLAARIERVANGDVVVRFAARPGVCGDGRGMIRDGRRGIMMSRSSVTTHAVDDASGRWCVAGPVQLVVSRSGGRVTGLRTSVGAPEAPPAGATDLGTAGAHEAVAYLLSLASAAGANVASDAIMPVALADSVVVWPELLRLVRDARRAGEVRRKAVHWVGFVGSPEAAGPLDSIARAPAEERGVREGALVALAELTEGTGVPALLALAGPGTDSWLRGRAIFWLGQTGDARAHAALRAMAASAELSDDLRGEAIFAIGHGEPSTDDAAFLRRIYPTLGSHTLRERTLQSVADLPGDENWRWLLGLAADPQQPAESRRQALFWAGQGAAPVAELVSLYQRLTDVELREHAIFVLSQQDESTATDALLDIARHDADPRMRRKALFWLGQVDDPRVATLIREMLAP